ncbi:uncharacterized protein LOC126895205 isoform X1 [Daktulosphaira vitifoliae]|uniref:uncharacterized protein LOC126895205 isoform X1 n=1 Tax=Daktulosphaira vitifoliae TaxID=58002 RepID=UPI0021A9D9A9|nr:uncharacterized protein LOC126895205 isoform X1 [Daktulosphaira vitifoliae]
MNGFALKTIAITLLVCVIIDLTRANEQQVLPDGPIITEEPPKSFKDKFNGFVTSVKEGASDAYESVSDSVSDAAKKLDEKRKQAVAGTKKLVNGAIEKIKNTYNGYKNPEPNEEDVPAKVQETAEDLYQETVKNIPQKPEKFTS